MKFDINNFEQRLKVINEFDGNLVYGASKFNKETNRSGVGRPSSGYLTKEQAQVINDTNVNRFIHKQESDWQENPSCPVCLNSLREKFIHRKGVDYYRCETCTHVYQDPVVKPDVAISLYENDKTASDIYTQPLQKEIDSNKYLYGLELLNQLGTPSQKKILDLGCGAGVFLEEAKNIGWEYCVGVDANSNYQSQYSNQPGLQYVFGDFEALEPGLLGNDFDAVSMWSVLEHIYKPTKFLQSVSQLMSPGALIFILVPNVKSLATRLMRELSPCFCWKHISYFSPESLKKIMEDAGFETVHMETIITEIDNIKSYMSGEYPYHGYGDPDNLFDFITPEYIHKNLLGSRLVGVFRK